MSERTSDIAFTLLRIGAGLQLFYFHGWSKLIGAYQHFGLGQGWKFEQGVGKLGFPIPILFASLSALTEGVLSLFFALGLFTRYAAIFIVINMSVAIYRHLTSDFRFELALLYGLIAFVFIFRAPGPLSIDAKR